MDDRIFKICLSENSIFENFKNPRKFCWCFFLQCIQREHVHNWNKIPVYNTLLVCLSVRLSFRLYLINVKKAEPIGPKFCVGPDVTPGKVYEWLKFKKLAKFTIFFLICKLIFVLFYNVWKRKCSQLK